jgi:solute carrier family 35 protein E3
MSYSLAGNFGFLTNLFSTLALIKTNKYIYSNFDYPNITLTCLHVFSTLACLCSSDRLESFRKIKNKKWSLLKHLLPTSICYCVSIIFANYSLKLNTIGTYQGLKSFATPLIIIMSMMRNQKDYSIRILLSVLTILIGVIIYLNYAEISVDILDLDFMAVAAGLFGAILTAVHQLSIQANLKEHDLNPLQLLIYQTGISTCLLSVVKFGFQSKLQFIENEIVNEYYFFKSFTEFFFIFLSCLLAFFVNISSFMMIRSTSTLTYNIMGYLKFIIIIIYDYTIAFDLFQIKPFFSAVLLSTG